MNKRVWPITLFFHGDKLRYMRLFVFGCLLVFVFAFVYPYLLKWYTKAPAIAEMGQYGDVYGGLNTLFTGLAFVGLVVTILLQRQEMKETREEFEKQTKQFQEQSVLLAEENKRNQLQYWVADIYKRIQMVKDLERQMRYEVVQTKSVKEKRNVYLRYESGAELIGEKALAGLSEQCAALFKLFVTEQLSGVDVIKYDGIAKGIFLSRVYLDPWLLSLHDLLVDIREYLKDSPHEMRRFYRVVFNSTSVHAKSLLCLFRGYIVPRELIDDLMEKGYIKNDCMSTLQTNEVARELFFYWIDQDIDLQQMLKKWEAHLKSQQTNREN